MSRGPGAGWCTVSTDRTQLVVVRTLTTLSRLLDVLSLTSDDRRIQTVFTHDSGRRSALAAGVEEALSELGVSFLPWDQATARHFDLAVAASENDRLADLDAPVLLLPHGAGQQKFYPRTSVVSGLNPERLVVDGRVVPAAIALSRQSHLIRLQESCPPAAPYGVVVGDPALARMRGSRFRAEHLRAAFGARDKQVVVVASTFGPDSVFGHLPDLPERLVAGLPADEYQVVVVLHPGVWAAHGPWQVRAWLSQAASCGLQIMGPQDGWQAALIAASVVISDHGSLALYASTLDKPVILAGRGSAVTVPGSAVAALAAAAPVWDPVADARGQLDRVIREHAGSIRQEVSAPVTDPGTDESLCAQRLRAVMYRLLELPEPSAPAAFGPVLAPPMVPRRVPAWVAGAHLRPDGVRIERYPALSTGAPHTGLPYRHLIADLRTASLPQMQSARIVVTDLRTAGSVRRWAGQALAQLGQWPQAAMLVTAVDDHTCAVRTRDGLMLATAHDVVDDPLVLASLVHARLAAPGGVLARDRLHLGDRVIAVTVAAD